MRPRQREGAQRQNEREQLSMGKTITTHRYQRYNSSDPFCKLRFLYFQILFCWFFPFIDDSCRFFFWLYDLYADDVRRGEGVFTRQRRLRPWVALAAPTSSLDFHRSDGQTVLTLYKTSVKRFGIGTNIEKLGTSLHSLGEWFSSYGE